MTEADQVLPTSTSIEDVPNADGSITRTTTIKYDDGSKFTKQEIVPSSDGQQCVLEPRDGLQIASIVLFIIAAIFGLLSFLFSFFFVYSRYHLAHYCRASDAWRSQYIHK